MEQSRIHEANKEERERESQSTIEPRDPMKNTLMALEIENVHDRPSGRPYNLLPLFFDHFPTL